MLLGTEKTIVIVPPHHSLLAHGDLSMRPIRYRAFQAYRSSAEGYVSEADIVDLQ